MTKIDEGAFAYQNSSYVTRCNVRLLDPEHTKNFVFQNGMLFSADKTVLLSCNYVYQDVLRIPDGVVRVGKSAAAGSLKVHRLVFPDSVVTIGEKAFADYGLDELVFSEGLREIEASAFFNSAPSKIILPDSLIRIGDFAFSGYSADIEQLKLPKNLQYLGKDVFKANSLTEVQLPKSLEGIGGMPWFISSEDSEDAIKGLPTKGLIEKDGFLLNAAGTVLYGSLMSNQQLSQGKLTIPNGVESIQTWYSLLEGTSEINEVILPSSLAEIGDYALKGYPEQDQLIVGGNIRTIGKCAFSSGAMRSLILDNGVLEIGEDAFASCDIEDATLPGSLRFVAEYAFENCAKLKTVVLNEGILQIGYAAFMDCEQLKDIYIPMSVTQIDDYAFLSDRVDEIRPMIHCEKESYAYQYAVDNGYDYVFDYKDGVAGGSARVISNNTRLSDDDAIRQLASFLIFVEKDSVTTPDTLTFENCIYMLRTMLVHSDAIIDERVSYTPPVTSVDDTTANEYIRLLFGRDIPEIDDYYVLLPGDSDTEFGWRDGTYYFGTGWWNVGKFNYGDGDVENITKNQDGTIYADIVFHPRDWMDTHVVMTLKPSNTAFRFQILSFKTTTTENNWGEERDPVDALKQAPSAQIESTVFPMSVPKRLEISEQEELFREAIELLDSDRLKATMMYDFSKRFSQHWETAS
ncbi:MAG TPA: leucine-rich repeat domain-containing protein, partial [Negativicutes bacterium]|nr:leucine-rich repeat domain-containing protein [Negativicutes bacterium]